MNVIVFSKRHGRARQFELGRPLAMTATIAVVTTVLAGTLFAGVQLGRSGLVLDPAGQVVEWGAKLEEQRAQIAQARRELQDRLDALAGRVGQITAHMIRLDALGRRLTEMANLDKGEFNFDTEPAVGGPEGLVEGAVATSPDHTAMLDDLTHQIRDRERQLSVLESLISTRNLSRQIVPGGRPVTQGWISSYFGRRADPFTGRSAFHRGIDFAGPAGAEVVSVAAGVVTYAKERFGYGRTVEINHGNGYVTRLKGVQAARDAGITVLVTDHHLPGKEWPVAHAIVNPNQPGCNFASKNLAGVGVIFYTLLALRQSLRRAGWFNESRPEPNMAKVLDLVALGTVADVVPLDDNNRILVEQGLKRIRAGQCCVGIQALLKVAGRDVTNVAASDMGFIVGPRLNAAGRLEDMSLGIECLLTDDVSHAEQLAKQLDQLNRSRRDIEQDMQQQAMSSLQPLLETLGQTELPRGLCLYDANWHQGVIGILAARIKDKFNRPVIAFARSDKSGEIKGSARSIRGLHIRDALYASALEFIIFIIIVKLKSTWRTRNPGALFALWVALHSINRVIMENYREDFRGDMIYGMSLSLWVSLLLLSVALAFLFHKRR